MPSCLWSGFACLEISISAKAEGGLFFMQNNDNQKTYFIYVRSTGEKVPVTKEQHDYFYKEADRIRHKEQEHGRYMCPYRFI